MASRELNILVAAKGALKAARDIGGVDSKIKSLSATAGRVGKFAAVGIAAAAGAGILLLQRNVDAGIAGLKALEQAELQTAAVITSTGGKARVTAAQVRKLAEAQESLTTVDDKVVQTGENMLLTFTNIGGDVFPEATKAMVNMGIAMNGGTVEGLELSKTAILIGKALNDPIKGVTALRKNGVALTEQQQKDIKSLVKQGKMREAQLIIIKELGVEFGKAGEAAGKGAGATQRRFSDAVEDAQMSLAQGLLPVIEEIQKEMTGLLSDKGNLDAIRNFGQGLAGVFRDGVAFAKRIPWSSIADAFKVMGTGAKAALDFFTGMPAWVQTAVVTGWGLNKITGGAVTNIVGELGKGLIKGVLGMTAGVVNVNAGVVNGAGSLPGVASGGGGLLAAAGGVAGIGAIVAAAAPFLLLLIPQIANPGFKKGVDPRITGSKGQGWETTPGDPRKGWMQGGRFNGKPLVVRVVGGLSMEQLISRQSRKDIRDRAIAAGRGGANGPTEAQITATAQRNQERLLNAQRAATNTGTNRIVNAINNMPGVSVRTVAATTNRWTRVSNHAPGTGPLAE